MNSIASPNTPSMKTRYSVPSGRNPWYSDDPAGAGWVVLVTGSDVVVELIGSGGGRTSVVVLVGAVVGSHAAINNAERATAVADLIRCILRAKRTPTRRLFPPRWQNSYS
jgi:hypothetical protein